MGTKKEYEVPILEVVKTEQEDIICTSGTPWPDDWNDALDDLVF